MPAYENLDAEIVRLAGLVGRPLHPATGTAG